MKSRTFSVLTGIAMLAGLALVATGCGENFARNPAPEPSAAEPATGVNAVASDAPRDGDATELGAREESVARRDAELDRRLERLDRQLAELERREGEIGRREAQLGRSQTVMPAIHEPQPDPRELPVTEPEPAPAPEPEPVVRTVMLTVPAATSIEVRLVDGASSESNAVGDRVRGRVTDDVFWRGYVAIPAGAEVLGRVSEVNAQKKIAGQTRLGIEFERIQLPSGEDLPIRTAFYAEGKKQVKKDAATIGGSAAGGAVLGRVLGKDSKGAAIGAVLGAAIGTAVAAKNQGDPIVLEPGSVLELRLDEPVDVAVQDNTGAYTASL